MIAGRYRLGEVLGVGSFATVYRATDDLLEDTVVVKMLAENHSLNPEIRERFIAEGRSLRKVASEHVVTVHDLGESSRQQPFLVLELANRGTLADRVQHLHSRGWHPTADDVLRVARPLAQALEAIHTAQLVHRDLSPGNVLLATEPTTNAEESATQLVAADERLLLADLGMCKDLALNSGLTVSGGTSGFRPPEQSQPGTVDTRADIWAASALIAWIAQDTSLPAAFHEVLRRGMERTPAHRHATITQWLAELETALRPTPPPPPPRDSASATSAPTPTTRTSGRRPFLLLVSLAVFAIGLVAGLWFGRSDVPSATADASIAIDGPEEISVGESATFSAETDGVHSWIWSLPTGTNVVDDEAATITATDPGSTEVILRARTPDGQELETRHRITVVE